MKIAVDARMLKMSGIGTYIKNLMKNDCYQIALGNKEDIKELNKIDENNIIEYNDKIYGIKEQLHFPYKELKKLKPDLLHVPHYNVPIFYRGKMAVTIHDLTHLKLKQFLPNKFAYLYAKFMMWIAIKKSNVIFTVSENSKQDILQYFKVNPDKIKVIYNGVDESFKKKSKEEIDYLYGKYNIPRDKKLLMYAGNLKPHKNVKKLLEAFSLLEDKENYRLLIIGKAFENYTELDDLEKELGIKDYIIKTGNLTQEQIIDMYNLADLFVFPSLYEGFGLPIIEALGCGTKVISSNTSSLPEVGGDVIEYFDPNNAKDICEKIKIAENKEFDQAKVKEWLAKFDWTKICDEVKENFEEN